MLTLDSYEAAVPPEEGGLAQVLERIASAMGTTWRALFIAAGALSAFRVAFLLRHGPPASHFPLASLASALVMGARFDLKTAAIAFLPLVVLAAVAPPGSRLRPLAVGYTAVAFLSLLLAGIVNDGYYGFYNRPLDAIVFGFAEDDTSAVWRSVWEDHPVVIGVVAVAALAAAATFLAFRARARLRPASLGSRGAAVALAAFALFLVARGRLGTFPLNEQDLAVSPEPFLNAATPNGAFALFLAWKQRASVSLGKDPNVRLRRLGFRTPGDAAAALGLAPPGAGDDDVAEALYRVTPENPAAAARPPHVVLAIMESWGADILGYHSPRLDLLGRLAPHVERGILFRRFLSAQNGTHPTLEALLLATPVTPLTYSAFGSRSYAQSAVLPFRAAGYRTVFATGGSGGWRNIARVLPQQGFDEVHDMSDVLATVPGARAGTWGVYDHELFAWAAARLREADARGERVLLVLLTTTNHPPYAVPPEYRVGPIDPAVYAGRAFADDPSLHRSRLETYQYACDALGGFLDAVRDGGLGDHTIVAATGDHNTRGLFAYPTMTDLARKYAVPFFLSAPQAYLAGRTWDPLRWGSHRDVFPTLAGLALSRARVFRSGDDLLAPPTRPARALAQYDTVLTDAGAIERIGSEAFLRWQDRELVPCADEACKAALGAIVREERAYVGLLDWYVRRQALRPAEATRPAMAVQASSHAGGAAVTPAGAPRSR